MQLSKGSEATTPVYNQHIHRRHRLLRRFQLANQGRYLDYAAGLAEKASHTD